jgi:hypothetical protein
MLPDAISSNEQFQSDSQFFSNSKDFVQQTEQMHFVSHCFFCTTIPHYTLEMKMYQMHFVSHCFFRTTIPHHTLEMKMYQLQR